MEWTTCWYGQRRKLNHSRLQQHLILNYVLSKVLQRLAPRNRCLMRWSSGTLSSLIKAHGAIISPFSQLAIAAAIAIECKFWGWSESSFRQHQALTTTTKTRTESSIRQSHAFTTTTRLKRLETGFFMPDFNAAAKPGWSANFKQIN